MASVDDLEQLVADFAARRDWEQFHTPRNLLLALMGEVGELAAELQWLSDEEVHAQLAGQGEGSRRSRVEQETADVLIYLLRFATVCGIDLEAAVRRKVSINESRYPADRARGRATKYTDLGD